MKGKKILELRFLRSIGILLLVLSFTFSSGLAQNTDNLLVRLGDTESEHLQESSVSSQKLMKLITLQGGEMQLKEALREIASQAGFKLSYSEQLIPLNKRINVKQAELTAKDALWRVLEGTGYRFGVSPSGQLFFVERQEPNTPPAMETVQGVVTDALSGETLPGVNVVIQGTTQGTATGADGSYSLNVPSLQDSLVFSFVGYQSQVVPIQGRTDIDVALQLQTVSGEELVVVGYGTQTRETLTGSISRVSGEDVAISPSVNVTSSLAGKLPGLVVNQRTGWPGDEQLDILIRGNATFDTDPDDGINTNAPLVVIDGVPRGNLSQLNPENVESITVLKDASAAIYGARAANGVILVTTKQGSQSDGPQFSFESSYAVNEPTKLPEMMDAALFAEVYNEAEWYRQGRPDMSSFSPFYSDEAIQSYRNGTDPILYPNTDWPAATMKSSYQSRVSLQASGGSENISYLLSFAYTDQDGNFKNNPTRYKQYNTRARVDADLTEDLSVTANVNAIINENYRPTTGVDFVGLLQSNPTLAAVYPNGLIAPGRFRDNPLLANRRGLDETYDYPIYATFSATYDIPLIEGLALDASYNYDLRNEFQKEFQRQYYWHEYNNQTGEYDRMESNEPITLNENYRRWQGTLFNARLSYKTSIGQNHNVSAMAGFEQQRDKFSYARAYRKDFVSQAIPQINVGSSDPEDQENEGSASESAYNNYFGRFNYDFQSKYLFEFVFRYDGSQIFPEGNRYGFFPAVSAGWRLSQEDFISDNLPFVNELKLRGSYGEIGNDRVPQYQYLQAFEFGNNYVFGGSDQPGIFSSTLPNPDITWEVSKKLDIGLEAQMWDGLLGADLTVFHENRSNILLARNLSVSNIFGFPELPDENIGEVENRGFEVALSHRNTVGDLAYSIEANTSFARSEIIYMDEVPPAEPYQEQTGSPLGSGLYYKSDGIFNTEEELNNYPHGTGAQVGDIKVLDLNDDGVINGEDRYRSQNSPVPEYVFGLNTSFRYKGFDLIMSFYGQTNAWTYDGVLAEIGESDLDNNTVYRATNRWTRDNKEGATMPRADEWTPGTTDFFLYDATFIRLKNLELGYNLPASVTSKISGLRNTRVFVNGTNLLTWSKEITWRDPEMQGGFTDYPPLRIINAGINIEF